MIICDNCNLQMKCDNITDFAKNKEARAEHWKVVQDGKYWRRFCCEDCKQEYITEQMVADGQNTD